MLSNFTEVTQQTYRQGRNKVYLFKLCSELWENSKEKVISSCKNQDPCYLMGVSPGQSLTAFMRLWNVSIDSTMTLWEGANQLFLWEASSSLLMDIFRQKRKSKLYFQNGSEEFGE